MIKLYIITFILLSFYSKCYGQLFDLADKNYLTVRADTIHAASNKAYSMAYVNNFKIIGQYSGKDFYGRSIVTLKIEKYDKINFKLK